MHFTKDTYTTTMYKNVLTVIFVIVVGLLAYGLWQLYATPALLPVPTPDMQVKLDIQKVCASALTYISFPDSVAADAFIAACVAGDHPEVIEKYRKDRGLNDATI